MHGQARRRWAGRLALRAVSALLGFAAACQGYELPTKPNYGFVRVSIDASGDDNDLNGYVITLDGTQTRTLKDTTVESFYVEVGAHSVAIDNVAANCSVKGASTRTAIVSQFEVTDVSFAVVCVPTGIALTVRTTGADSPNEFRVTVDQQPSVSVAPNGSRRIGRQAPGTHTVTLLAPSHCTVAGGNPIAVSVVASRMTELSFDVTCVPVVRLPRIAYASDDADNGASGPWIELVTVDGTGAVTVQRGDSPAWSPDGTRLAFSDAECWDLYYLYDNYCSGGLIVVDPEIGDVNAPPAGRSAFHPSWAPTNDAIALEVPASNLSARALVVLRPFFGAVAPTSLFSNVAGVRSSGQPAWSPDGKWIAFACTWLTITDLCLVSADGSGFQRLNEDAQFDQRPAWSPDGKWLAFTRFAVGRSDDESADVAVMDVATRRITLLGPGRDPAWSPDGTKLVLAGTDGLFVMNADGSNRARVTTGRHHAPAWRPR